MKLFARLIFFLLIMGMLVLPVVLMFLAIETTPRIVQGSKLSFDNVKKVKKLIDDTMPQHLRKRQAKEFSISESDLNIIVSYGISQVLKEENVFSRIALSHEMLEAFVTVHLPANPVGDYVNLSVRMKNLGAHLAVDRVKAGKVVIPGALIKPVIGVLDYLLAGSNLYDRLKESARSVRQIHISDTQLKIFYDWDPGAMDKLHETGKSLFISASHQEKLVRYYNKLVEVSMPHKNRKISLTEILNPMFRFAAGQSEISNDPILENTALLQVMSLHASGKGLKAFVLKDIQKQVTPMVKISLTLWGRNDLARHFLISAGLAVSGGSKLASFIGLAKEVGDSDQGSGFSFADLAADKAGVKMGELAIASSQTARLLQTQMGIARGEAAFMPVIDNLPEGIMELEFKKKYTDLDSDSYAMVNREIEKRISQCPVYQ